ncbi:hypothetical protein Cadr_000020222 [Camelus dromedarius]|uniref:Uncharacterized protein n=1 Tax=Camelus dromedarius TaxID=9838 RepID=A0A5N4CZY2_CAMDR|nr:hypothetical protein Cadr_000020222 [Camelus dromedarius]
MTFLWSVEGSWGAAEEGCGWSVEAQLVRGERILATIQTAFIRVQERPGEGLGKRRARNDQAFGAGKIRQQIPKPEIQASKPCETCPVTKGAWPGPLWASLGLLCGWHSCSVGKGAGEAGYRAGSPSSPAEPVARL